MKTNAIISALCVVGIIGALCSNGEEQRSVVEPRPGALPVQKVVYWSDIPGMKWDWPTQVTNAPAFVTQSVTNGLASTNEVNLKYTKPAGGIPKSDLEVGVQTSLNYADVAIFRVWYPDGSVTSESQFTSGLKYDLDGNGNAVIKTFYNTRNAANDNSDKVGAVVIPPYIVDGNGVRHTVVGIGSGGGSSSSNPKLTSATIPSTVTSIGNAAFRQCTSLTSVTIPDGVTSIEGRMFMYCSKLASVTIPDGVTSIGGNAFQNCSSLTGLTIPKGVTSIGNWAFNGCSGLEFVDFGDTAFSSIPTLGSQVFDNVPTTCKFIVPDSQYDTWKAASGWSSLVSAGYTFLRHSEWEYVRRYELASSISTATNGLASKTYVDSHKWDWGTQITNKPSLATVATSGSYNDLSDKPSIPAAQVNSDWNANSGVAQILNKPTLATVATSGSYNDLSNKPTIPSASDFVQKSGDTMTGNLTIDPANESINPFIKVFNSDSMSSAYKMLTPQGLVSGYNNGGSQDTYTITFQDKSGTMALNEDVIAIIPAWTRSSAVSYTAGDLVRYNNKLYKAKQNIAANQAWNANNWEEVTIAAEFRSKANTSWVNNHKWDWVTQVTNAPGFLASESDPTVGWTNGTLYVHGDTIEPVEYQQDHSVILPKLIASSGMDGAELNSVGFVQGAGVTIPTGAGIYSAVLGLNAASTNQFAFVYSGRGENQYYSHGNGTFNIDPIGGASGFWIGETNLATYLANAGSGEHTHSNLVNGTTQVIANQNGTASIIAPIEWAFVTQLTASQKQSLAQYMQSQYSFNGDWTITINDHNASWWENEFASGTHSGIDYENYMSVKIGNVTAAMGIMDWDNKICICSGGDANILNVLIPSYEPQVSPIAQFIGGIKTIATVDQLPTIPANVSAFNNDANYTSGQIATNIARQIIRDAVSQVNVNLQSAEDTRAALTNLITILKNL